MLFLAVMLLLHLHFYMWIRQLLYIIQLIVTQGKPAPWLYKMKNFKKLNK